MRTILLSAFALTLTACFGDRDIEGSGRLIEENRSVSAFHAVAISDGLRTEITVGPADVYLRLDDNILPHIHVEVREGVLVIEADDHDVDLDPSGDALVRIASPTIDAVTVSDGASATAQTNGVDLVFRSDDGAHLVVDARDASIVRASAHDGSRIVLRGDGAELELDSSDGSNIDSQMLAKNVGVRSHDGSEVRAHASRSARIVASDGSNVHIQGNPPNREVSSSDGSSVDFF